MGEATSNLSNNVSNGFKNLGTNLKNGFDTVKELLRQFTEFVSGIFSKLGEIIGAIISGFADVIKSIGQNFLDLLSWLKDSALSVVSFVVELPSTILKFLQDWLIPTPQFFTEQITNILDKLNKKFIIKDEIINIFNVSFDQNKVPSMKFLGDKVISFEWFIPFQPYFKTTFSLGVALLAITNVIKKMRVQGGSI